MLSHNNAPVHQVSSMETQFANSGVEQRDCLVFPDLNPTEKHLSSLMFLFLNEHKSTHPHSLLRRGTVFFLIKAKGE